LVAAVALRVAASMRMKREMASGSPALRVGSSLIMDQPGRLSRRISELAYGPTMGPHEADDYLANFG
jgi:hypothetical protein